MLPGIVAAILFGQFSGEAVISDTLSGLKSAMDSARSAYSQSDSLDNKREFVLAIVDYATAVMTSPKLPPNEKYPKSLKLYREALKLDPTQAEAKENSDMIESIYKSLGKPIPE